MPDEYKYDVFISYSHKDEDWVVNTILPALEKAGLKVCIDFRNFEPGVPSLVNMENAVDESRQTVLVLTPNWTDSEWTNFEAILTQTDDPVGRRKKMIPLMLEECTPPKRIKTLTYVDFMRADRIDIAWKQLFTALGEPDAPIPTTIPVKPTPETSQEWHLAHPYPMPPNFTGREVERKMLTEWLENDAENRLFILRALGGFGKSALSWHWLTHDVNTKDWPKVVWWSFYEGDASFEHFIEETLKYLDVDVPQGQRTQVDALLKVMGKQKILLIMDGFERVLRAYSSMNAAYQSDEEQEEQKEETLSQRDCVNLNAEIFLKNLCVLPDIKGKVLMTTRLTPRAVEQRGELLDGCHEVELQAMQKGDTVDFFRAQGIRGARAEIETACQSYGYHPLSLRILAGLIANDRETPGDITAAGKLDITDDVVQNKHHVLEVAYNTLSPEQQKLLSHIACFRSAMNYDALNAISDENIDADLKTLEHRGLLHWYKTANKYDLHPIVRRYAYERLTAQSRIVAHTYLRDYFDALPKPEKIDSLNDLASLIELYHHTVRSGDFDTAWKLFRDRIRWPLFYRLGGYQTQIELLRALFVAGENKDPKLKSEIDQSHVMNSLAGAYAKSGQPHQAISLALSSIETDEKIGNKNDFTVSFGNVSILQMVTGSLQKAERNLRHSIDLCHSYEDEFLVFFNHEYWEAVGHRETGRFFMYCGKWRDSERELNIAIKMFDKQNSAQSLSVTWSEYSLRYLLMARAISHSKPNNLKSSIRSAAHALDLAKNSEEMRTSNIVDFVRAHWLLGAAHCAYSILPKRGSAGAQKDIMQAESHLSEALMRCRAINNVEHEADILLDLARLHYIRESYDEANTLAKEALLITERCGYVLQGADVYLFLAQFALEQEKDKEKAKELAERAKELATCDGPPYYYKVAYEEAEMFLEKLEE